MSPSNAFSKSGYDTYLMVPPPSHRGYDSRKSFLINADSPTKIILEQAKLKMQEKVNYTERIWKDITSIVEELIRLHSNCSSEDSQCAFGACAHSLLRLGRSLSSVSDG